MPGEQGGGTGEGRQIPGRAGQPERRGETALPDGPAIKGRNTPARLPPRFPAPGKCTSHLGFGLGSQFSHVVGFQTSGGDREPDGGALMFDGGREFHRIWTVDRKPAGARVDLEFPAWLLAFQEGGPKTDAPGGIAGA